MAAFNNCLFLYLGNQGICPYNIGKKKCYHKCDKYSQITDESTEIYKDWMDGINKLAIELRQKYFGIGAIESTEENEQEIKKAVKSNKPKNDNDNNQMSLFD